MRGLKRGVTTTDGGHVHRYIVRANGNVDILPTYHPETKQIHHTHIYVGKWPNGYITDSKSDCHPNCFKQYGYHGVGNHNHKISVANDKSFGRIPTPNRKRLVGNRFSVSKKGT